jgi:hypothetical protein
MVGDLLGHKPDKLLRTHIVLFFKNCAGWVGISGPLPRLLQSAKDSKNTPQTAKSISFS